MKSLTVCVAVSFIILEKPYEMVKHAGMVQSNKEKLWVLSETTFVWCHSLTHTFLWGLHLLVLYPYKAWPIEELSIWMNGYLVYSSYENFIIHIF